jgi:hypothetical protein
MSWIDSLNTFLFTLATLIASSGFAARGIGWAIREVSILKKSKKHRTLKFPYDTRVR